MSLCECLWYTCLGKDHSTQMCGACVHVQITMFECVCGTCVQVLATAIMSIIAAVLVAITALVYIAVLIDNLIEVIYAAMAPEMYNQYRYSTDVVNGTHYINPDVSHIATAAMIYALLSCAGV